MKKAVHFLVILFSSCLGLGFLISEIEKKKGKPGWVKDHRPYGPYEKYFKRPLDAGLSLFALLFLWPIFLIVALIVSRKMGKPVLFEQDRPGLGGKIFKIKKFRTMTEERDSDGNLLPDERRLTKTGKIIRATSVDELPELINIIKGDMSIVGPRPLLVKYLSRYNEKQKHRHDVRPGLTGYAQAHGRNSISWKEKFDDDIFYVDHVTFINDVLIIKDTIKSVLRHEGIHSDTSETMEEFLGDEYGEQR